MCATYLVQTWPPATLALRTEIMEQNTPKDGADLLERAVKRIYEERVKDEEPDRDEDEDE